jgi:RNA polymerase sigma-70 factor (ECF subfamily)
VSAAVVDAAGTRRVELAAVEPLEVSWGFEDFFRREYPALVAVGAAMMQDHGDAEDLAQDSMVKAFVRWGRVGRLERPGAWCHRVLLNAIRSRWRRRITERRYLAGQRRSDAWSAGPSPDVVAFWAAVRQLPSRPRAAVALHFAADLTTADVATVLGVPEGTVRSDIARARAFVMAQLEERS